MHPKKFKNFEISSAYNLLKKHKQLNFLKIHHDLRRVLIRLVGVLTEKKAINVSIFV